MRQQLITLIVLAALSAGYSGYAHEAQKAAPAGGPLVGRWTVTSDFHGTTLYFKLELEQQGEKLTGNFDGDKLEGSVHGSDLDFLAKDVHGGSEEAKASVKGGTIAGTMVFVSGDDPAHPETHPFTATLVPARKGGAPQRHDFTPTVFYRRFSPENKPVLSVEPGDTIHTTTVDAGGTDEKGVTRVLGGNPETAVLRGNGRA